MILVWLKKIFLKGIVLASTFRLFPSSYCGEGEMFHFKGSRKRKQTWAGEQLHSLHLLLPTLDLFHCGEGVQKTKYLKPTFCCLQVKAKQSQSIQWSSFFPPSFPLLLFSFHVILFSSFSLGFNSFSLFFFITYLICYFSFQHGRTNYLFRWLPNLSKLKIS